MDAAVLCPNCAWFGVYREDVPARIRGCPICGCPNLTVRDVENEQWQTLGRQLLESVPDEKRPRRPR